MPSAVSKCAHRRHNYPLIFKRCTNIIFKEQAHISLSAYPVSCHLRDELIEINTNTFIVSVQVCLST